MLTFIDSTEPLPGGRSYPQRRVICFCSSPDASASLAFLGSNLKGCARLGCRLQAGLEEGPAMATFYGRMNWKNKSRAVHSSQRLLLILHLQCIGASRKHPIPMGRARVMRSIPTASSHSFSFTLEKKSFCTFQCSVFLLFRRVKSSWASGPGDQPDHPSLSKATPWVAAAGSAVCSRATSPLLPS